MFGMISKGDLQKLLVAGGTSLETILNNAEQEAQHALLSANTRITSAQEVIAKAQASIAADRGTVKEASRITQIVRTLTGG